MNIITAIFLLSPFFPTTTSIPNIVELKEPDVIKESAIPKATIEIMPRDSVRMLAEEIHHTWDKIMLQGMLIDRLDKFSRISLPVGVNREIGGQDYGIMITGLRVERESAKLEAALSLYEPFSGQKLAFYGNDIGITDKGGLTGTGTLQLLEDFQIKVNSSFKLILRGGADGTFAAWDCDGFQFLNLKGELVFNQSIFSPADGSKDTLKADFELQVSNWDDFLIEVSIDPFKVKGLEGYKFLVEQAMLDFSDLRNPMNLPVSVANNKGNLWRGIYLKKAAVFLPSQFKANDRLETPRLELEETIIDHSGISTMATGTNLLNLKQGDMGGWPFSIDSMQINIVQNRLEMGYFLGEMLLPLTSKQKPLQYTAIMTGQNYHLELALTDSAVYKMPVFNGEIVFLSGSYLELKVNQQKFLPVAHLNGYMNIDAPVTKATTLKIEHLEFSGLHLSSTEPYLTVDHFGSKGDYLEQKFGDFTLNIDQVLLVKDKERIGLQILSCLNLVKDSDHGFGADNKITVWGNIRRNSDGVRFYYDFVQVNKIALDIEQGAFAFKGSAEFFKRDPVYGDGFAGELDVKFPAGFELKASALFGSTAEFRYWYADAGIRFSPGMPVGGVISLNGFGGGAFYHMRQSTQDSQSEIKIAGSGSNYRPDPTVKFGMKASTSFVLTGAKDLLHGIAVLEVVFNQNGGLGSITFEGAAEFLSAPPAAEIDQLISKNILLTAGNSGSTLLDSLQNKPNSGNGAITASLKLVYDNPSRTLHGNFEAYVNFASGMIRGIGPAGRAGQAVLHVAPDSWYFYLGEPANRIGLSLGIGDIRANVTGYFVTGSEVPPPPAPPHYINDILGFSASDLNYTKDLGQLKSGFGVAFGADFRIETGRKNFLIFYGDFAAGAGFDIMLKKYNKESICTNTNETIGLNGWYANGQAYAFFQGDIGITVHTTFFKGDYTILNIAAAAILQAKLPNPFWMMGAVGGKYNILGGLVKGNCKFEIELGKECKLDGVNPLDQIEVIADIRPVEGEKQVNVFTSPQVSFNLALESPYEFYDLNKQHHSVRVKLDEFKVINDREIIPGSLIWNEAKTTCSFVPDDILPGKVKLQVVVSVSFEERKNNQWLVVKSKDQKVREEKRMEFTTDQAPDHLVHNNIKFSYPVDRQLHFYVKQSTLGYIQLYKGQDYLFDKPGWIYQVIFKDFTGSKQVSSLIYAKAENRINFQIPSGLKSNSIYAMMLVAKPPVHSAGKLDQNLKTSYKSVDIGAQTVDIRSNKLTENFQGVSDNTLHHLNFQTSQYATIEKKLESIITDNCWRWPLRNEVHMLGTIIKGDEHFDLAELKGGPGFAPLIQLEAILDQNKYYQNFSEPVIYQNYPYDNCELQFRSADDLGIPPIKAMHVNSTNKNTLLSDAALQYGTPQRGAVASSIIYNLTNYYNKDYIDLRTQLAIRISNGKLIGERGKKLFEYVWQPIPEGEYEYKVSYFLPGSALPVFERKIKLNHEIQVQL